MSTIRKIEGTKITYPHYEMDGLSCQYCKDEEENIPASLPVEHSIFEVTLKNGFKFRVCPVCLYENGLEDPNAMDVIKNIGEW